MKELMELIPIQVDPETFVSVLPSLYFVLSPLSRGSFLSSYVEMAKKRESIGRRDYVPRNSLLAAMLLYHCGTQTKPSFSSPIQRQSRSDSCHSQSSTPTRHGALTFRLTFFGWRDLGKQSLWLLECNLRSNYSVNNRIVNKLVCLIRLVYRLAFPWPSHAKVL
jgi:hypothetical protein